MTPSLRRSLGALAVMVCAAAVSAWLTPTIMLAKVRTDRVVLEAAVPQAFGSWRLDPVTVASVVNPQQLEMINKLYTQTLSRTYVNAQGQRIMLSIAYGEDQRDGFVVHHPEICYPAQGFDLLSIQAGVLQTPAGAIPVRRLETSAFKSQRLEPVTYWTTVGNRTTLGGVSKKLAEMHYSLHGQVPDGLLFRVSSIGAISSEQFALQDSFVRDLLPYLAPSARLYLAGLP